MMTDPGFLKQETGMCGTDLWSSLAGAGYLREAGVVAQQTLDVANPTAK